MNPLTKIRTAERRAQTIAYIEHQGPFDKLPFSADIERLYAWAREAHARPGMRPLAVYLDDPATTPPERLRTQVAIPVHGRPAPGQGIALKELPAMRVASARHHGPARDFPATYRAIGEFAKAHGLEAAGPAIETYTRRPKGEGPEAVITCTVELPVRPKAAS